jgi:2-amino-4-hydroxy-6-hydroxymethyldihydropteridine diphosphokinase
MITVRTEERPVQYAEWEPQYVRILRRFGYSWERERAAARRLRRLLPAAARLNADQRIAARLSGRDAIVVGLAPHAGAPPLWKLPPSSRPPAIVAADGAAAHCLDAGLVPEVVATDLDGPVPSEVSANARGALVVVHAHGDNLSALERWVPEFGGELAGSWSGPPGDGLIDVGGFTDGDRAACLAHHFGAARVLLWGFDFHNVEEEEIGVRENKRAKLGFAQEIIGLLASRPPPRVFVWAPDGRLSDYAGNEMGPSTQ